MSQVPSRLLGGLWKIFPVIVSHTEAKSRFAVGQFEQKGGGHNFHLGASILRQHFKHLKHKKYKVVFVPITWRAVQHTIWFEIMQI